MTEKQIDSLEPIWSKEIEQKVAEHIKKAEFLAPQQYDVWLHRAADYPDGTLLNQRIAIIKKAVYNNRPLCS